MNTKPSVLKKIISAFNFQLSIKINGKKFKVPVILNMGFLNLKIKEDWFSNFLKSHPLPKDTVFVDVGVNVGQTLLTFRSCSNNFYFGFEPNPSCVFYLRSLISANKFSNVQIIPAGLSTEDNLAAFYTKNESDSAGTIRKDLRPGYYSEENINYVPLFSFDNLKLKFPGKVSLIKIDVEGAELEVVKGMTKILAEQSPLLICEILDAHSQESLASMQQRANELINLLHSNNYSLFRIQFLNHKLKFEKLDEVKLKIWTPESWNTNDYLAVPKGNSTFE